MPTFSGSQTRSGGFVEGSHRWTGVCCLGFETLSMVFLILLPRTMECCKRFFSRADCFFATFRSVAGGSSGPLYVAGRVEEGSTVPV